MLPLQVGAFTFETAMIYYLRRAQPSRLKSS